MKHENISLSKNPLFSNKFKTHLPNYYEEFELNNSAFRDGEKREYLPGRKEFAGPYLPTIYKTKGKKTWKVAFLTYEEFKSALNLKGKLQSKNEAGYVLPQAGVVAVLKTGDNKIVYGAQGFSAFSKSKEGFIVKDEASEETIEIEGKNYLLKPSSEWKYDIPGGIVEFESREEIESKIDHLKDVNLGEYISDLVLKNASKELEEELCPIDKLEISKEPKILGFERRERLNIKKDGLPKDIEAVKYFIVLFESNLTSEKMNEVLKQERGDDMVELPRVFFSELDKLPQLFDGKSCIAKYLLSNQEAEENNVSYSKEKLNRSALSENKDALSSNHDSFSSRK
jgi:hypothetical protein